MSLSERAAHPTGHDAVQVFSAFDVCWYRGFEIGDVVMDESGVVGYHVVCSSDRRLLPAVFTTTDIRSDNPSPRCNDGDVTARSAGA